MTDSVSSSAGATTPGCLCHRLLSWLTVKIVSTVRLQDITFQLPEAYQSVGASPAISSGTRLSSMPTVPENWPPARPAFQGLAPSSKMILLGKARLEPSRPPPVRDISRYNPAPPSPAPPLCHQHRRKAEGKLGLRSVAEPKCPFPCLPAGRGYRADPVSLGRRPSVKTYMSRRLEYEAALPPQSYMQMK